MIYAARAVLDTAMQHYAHNIQIPKQLQESGASRDMVARAEALVLKTEVMLIAATALYLSEISHGARGPALRHEKPADH